MLQFELLKLNILYWISRQNITPVGIIPKKMYLVKPFGLHVLTSNILIFFNSKLLHRYIQFLSFEKNYKKEAQMFYQNHSLTLTTFTWDILQLKV